MGLHCCGIGLLWDKFGAGKVCYVQGLLYEGFVMWRVCLLG